MTVTTETETTADETAPPASTTEAPETQTDNPPKGNREARYRVERNQAREALTAAEARVEALQLREVSRLASEHLAQPEDLLSLGEHGLADFLTEDGEIDPEAVAEAVSALIEARPGLARNPRVGATDPTQGQGGGQGKPAPSWVDLFKD